jgi:hypothetical protein
MSVDRQLGDSGEKEAKFHLERALLGTAAQFSGFSDQGVDLLVQFPSPSPTSDPLYFGVQVKTGDSFAVQLKGRWKIQNLHADRFSQWQRSPVPMLFVWVRPTTPTECYYGFIRPQTARLQFTLSKRAIISPTLRYDIALEMFASQKANESKPCSLLRPPLTSGIRPHAKDFYRTLMKSESPVHPLLGPVRFTWRGWKHLTAGSRPTSHIHQSLQLLPSVFHATQHVTRFCGMRRLGTTVRGQWITETRLLVFHSDCVAIRTRVPADLVLVYRENIRYPKNWLTLVDSHKRITRSVAFESIYERASK